MDSNPFVVASLLIPSESTIPSLKIENGFRVFPEQKTKKALQ
jgi:hypothetical protein